MERDLREHFEWALGDDPGVVPGEMARAAIVEGGRLRRRRHQWAAAGLVVVAGAVAGLALGGRAADPPTPVAAAMMPVAAPSCTERPVERDATDVAIFLDRALSGQQLAVVRTALEADPRVDVLNFESPAQAYDRFRALWAQEPDLVAAVGAGQFPASFRLRLVAAAQYTAVRSDYAAMDGVDQIVGRRCPKDAPVGGVL